MKERYRKTAVEELGEAAVNMYAKGWAERNGGNISCLLTQEEAEEIAGADAVLRQIPLDTEMKGLAGQYILVTGTGKYFKNMEKDPENNMGIVRISADGKNAELIWGLNDGGNVTSEFSSHLMTHLVRREADFRHRVVIHTHPTHLIVMSFLHELTDKAFTNTLWKMCTECILVFPDGIGVIPWMVSANSKIAALTAEKMKEHHLTLWGQHGIYGTGQTFDEVLGLIETVEKAAEIYLKIKDNTWRQGIDDRDLQSLAETYKLVYRKDYLNF